MKKLNKLFKSFVIILTILFFISPICFGVETPNIKEQIKKEDGSLFEKIIAECIGGLAETILDFTTRRESECRF